MAIGVGQTTPPLWTYTSIDISFAVFDTNDDNDTLI